ncbi:hypothetical protein BC936DRAFT_144041, partial [Jimgerdemannia flammicorona]
FRSLFVCATRRACRLISNICCISGEPSPHPTHHVDTPPCPPSFVPYLNIMPMPGLSSPRLATLKILLHLPRDVRARHRRSKSSSFEDTFSSDKKRFWRSSQSLSELEQTSPVMEKDAKYFSSSLFSSNVYSTHLVDTDLLCDLLKQLRTDQDYDLNVLANFISRWQKELEKLASFAQKAADHLSSDITLLTQNLCVMSSPISQPQKTSLYVIREFLAKYRADLEDENHFAPEQSGRKEEELWADDEGVTECPTHFGFYSRLKRRDMAFAEYFADLKERLVVSSKKLPQKQCRAYLSSVLRVERDLYMYTALVCTQFAFLREMWSAMELAMRGTLSQVDLKDFEAFVRGWEEKEERAVGTARKFLMEIKKVLTDSTPALEDFTCAICLSLYYEPTLLPSCHHRFCRTCIEQLPIYDPKTSSTPILPLLLDSADPQKSCPLCRTPFHPSSCVEDTALINFLKLYFPREMNGLRKERGSEQNKERIKKWIKNSAMAGAPALLMMAGAPVIYNVDHGGAWDVAGGREAEDERPSGFEMMSYVAWL